MLPLQRNTPSAPTFTQAFSGSIQDAGMSFPSKILSPDDRFSSDAKSKGAAVPTTNFC